MAKDSLAGGERSAVFTPSPKITQKQWDKIFPPDKPTKAKKK